MDVKKTNRQLRAEETRERIVQAAKALIATKGFDETSIEDITARAGVSIGSFYTYFKRKEDVVRALDQTDFFRLAEITNEMTDKDIYERLAYYCSNFLRDIEETGIEICRQWLKNNISPTDMLLGGIKTTKYRYDFGAMRSILNEAVKRGELSSNTPVDDLALFITAQLYGLMVIWCMTDSEVTGSEKTDLLCEEIIKKALNVYKI